MSLLPFPGVQSGNGAELNSANATITQATVAATRVVVVGSEVQIPNDGLKVGTRYRARLVVTKTAAGTAVGTIDVATIPRGAANLLVANATARVSLAKVAGTADVAGAVIYVEVVVRSVSATGVLYGDMIILNQLGGVLGVINLPVAGASAASGAFDNSDLAGGYLCVALTTGAGDVYTVQEAGAELIEPGTP